MNRLLLATLLLTACVTKPSTGNFTVGTASMSDAAVTLNIAGTRVEVRCHWVERAGSEWLCWHDDEDAPEVRWSSAQVLAVQEVPR